MLQRAVDKHVFGTKMRSVIHSANVDGIRQVVEQQFAIAKQVIKAGLVPIIEPEVDITSASKEESEQLLKEELKKNLAKLAADDKVIFKLTIPSVNDFYKDLLGEPHLVRIVALSGGYSRDEADRKLAHNHGIIASFSRALVEDLSASQTDAEFDKTLGDSIEAIYAASVT